MARDHEKTKEHAFDTYCKKVMRNKARDLFRRADALHRREIAYCEAAPCDLARMSARDAYFRSAVWIEIEAIGAEVQVVGPDLTGALLALNQPGRDIVLLSYFLDLRDGQIAVLVGMPRSTIQYHRAAALRAMRRALTAER